MQKGQEGKKEEIKEDCKSKESKKEVKTKFIFHSITIDTSTGSIVLKVKGDIRVEDTSEAFRKYRLNPTVGNRGIQVLETVEFSISLQSVGQDMRNDVYAAIASLGQYAEAHLGSFMNHWNYSCGCILDAERKTDVKEDSKGN